MQTLFNTDDEYYMTEEQHREKTTQDAMTLREFYHRLLIIFVLVPLVFALIWLLVK